MWNPDTKKPGRIFHDLRRSAVRNLVRAGVPETVSRRISGHLTASVFLRYDIVSGEDLRRAAASLDGFLNGTGSPDEEDKDESRPKRRKVKTASR